MRCLALVQHYDVVMGLFRGSCLKDVFIFILKQGLYWHVFWNDFAHFLNGQKWVKENGSPFACIFAHYQSIIYLLFPFMLRFHMAVIWQSSRYSLVYLTKYSLCLIYTTRALFKHFIFPGFSSQFRTEIGTPTLV